MKKKNNLSIAELARFSGVSPSTVSRVINNRPGVSEEIYNKVLNTIHKYGIHLAEIRSGKIAVKKAIAVIIPDGKNPFFHLILSGVEEICRKHGYQLFYSSSRNNTEEEKRNLQKLLEINIPGIILIPHSNETEGIKKLIDSGVKIVLADRTIEGIDLPYVITNNENGAYQATLYLLDLGHRSFLYVGGDKNLSTEKSRFRGFTRALEEEGVEIEPEMIIEDSFDSERAYDCVREIINRRKKFTAVFCADDLIAFGAKNAIVDAGISIPDEVSIIGYDDIPFAGYMSLTTVYQPAEEIGRNAMLLLLDALHGRLTEPQKIVLEPSLKIRATCARYGIGSDSYRW